MQQPLSSKSNQREFAFDDRDFKRVQDLIYLQAGIALTHAKRDMVYGRLSRRLRALNLSTFKSYLDQLEAMDESAAEWQAFINALTTNLTSFFRESHHFQVLRDDLLRRKKHETINIWSCAASTGEEPYSIAMTACEAFKTLTPPVRILATDIDTNVLETAVNGIYNVERINDLDPSYKRKYFQRGSGSHEGKCRVVPALQQLIEFRPLNLLSPHYNIEMNFSAIFCRNVMIYFDKPTQHSILSRIVPHLENDGFLYTGHSENYIHASDLIESSGRTLYRRATKGAKGNVR